MHRDIGTVATSLRWLALLSQKSSNLLQTTTSEKGDLHGTPTVVEAHFVSSRPANGPSATKLFSEKLRRWGEFDGGGWREREVPGASTRYYYMGA